MTRDVASELFEAHKYIAEMVAKRISRSDTYHLAAEDVQQEAYMSLWKACQNGAVRADTPKLTYTIVSRDVADAMTRAAPIPKHTYKKLRKIVEASDVLRVTGLSATDSAIGELLELPCEEVRRILSYTHRHERNDTVQDASEAYTDFYTIVSGLVDTRNGEMLSLYLQGFIHAEVGKKLGIKKAWSEVQSCRLLQSLRAQYA